MQIFFAAVEIFFCKWTLLMPLVEKFVFNGKEIENLHFRLFFTQIRKADDVFVKLAFFKQIENLYKKRLEKLLWISKLNTSVF